MYKSYTKRHFEIRKYGESSNNYSVIDCNANKIVCRIPAYGGDYLKDQQAREMAVLIADLLNKHEEKELPEVILWTALAAQFFFSFEFKKFQEKKFYFVAFKRKFIYWIKY